MVRAVPGKVVGGVVVPQAVVLPEGLEVTILVPEGSLASGDEAGDLWDEIEETRRLARELLDQAPSPPPKPKP